MKILSLIPARSGSKGLRHKNIKKINGKALLSHAISSAALFSDESDIILSTDDPSYYEIAQQQFKNIDYSPRPSALSCSDTLIIDVVLYELSRFFSYRNKSEYDYLLMLEPSHYGSRQNISNAISVARKKKLSFAFGAENTPKKYHYKKQIVFDSKTEKIRPMVDHINRQSLGASYIRSGEFYLLHIATMIESGSFWSGAGEAFITQGLYANIDTVSDYENIKTQVEQDD